MSVVTVLTPNGRRQNVKCLPNQTIMQILVEVCEKHKFAIDNFELVHHRRVLDLTQMFRFAGLPNNAQLEMRESAVRRRVDEDVTLMLQLESGERLPGQFRPDQTIAEILQHLCPADVSHTGPNVVCVYMRTEIHGAALASTNLRSLGLTSGRAIMRLMHKNPESLKVQANVSAPLPPRPVEPEVVRPTPPLSVVESAVETMVDVVCPEPEIKPEPMEEEQTTPLPEEAVCPSDSRKVKRDPGSPGIAAKITKQEPIVHVLGYRNAIIFSLDAVRAAVHNYDDSFYAVSVNDLKVLLRDLKCQTQGMDDAPLLTTKMRELDEAKKTLIKMTRYKETVIRVQFPDRLVLQGTFAAVDTIATVMEFVREYIIDPHLDFGLFTTPPKVIQVPELTLVEAQCVPSAVLHFGPTVETEMSTFLKPECTAMQSTPSAAVLEASKFRRLRPPSSDSSVGASGSDGAHGYTDPSRPHQAGGSFKPSTASGAGEQKVPKWFKPTGK